MKHREYELMERHLVLPVKQQEAKAQAYQDMLDEGYAVLTMAPAHRTSFIEAIDGIVQPRNCYQDIDNPNGEELDQQLYSDVISSY